MINSTKNTNVVEVTKTASAKARIRAGVDTVEVLFFLDMINISFQSIISFLKERPLWESLSF